MFTAWAGCGGAIIGNGTADSEGAPDATSSASGMSSSSSSGSGASSNSSANGTADSGWAPDATPSSSGSSSSSSSSSSNGSGASSNGGADASVGARLVTLTVMNFDGRCDFEIRLGNSLMVLHPGEAGAVGRVASGSTVTIEASAGTGFEVAAEPWFGIDQNDGGAATGVDTRTPGVGEITTGTVTIGPGPTQCVSVCCTLPDGDGCPTANPCM